MGARSETKAQQAIAEIRKELQPDVDADIHFLALDLISFASVVAAAEEVKRRETALHGLVNNAGIMGVPFALTEDGYEIQWQVGRLVSSLCPGFIQGVADQ